MSGFSPLESSASRRKVGGFTLVELLVVFGILAVLVTLIIRIAPAAFDRAKQTTSLNNLRQIGAGFMLYTGDHEGSLPQRVTSGEKWPSLLDDYTRNTKVLADPSHLDNHLQTKTDPLDDTQNRTSYILNSFNHYVPATPDLDPPNKFIGIPRPSQIILATLLQPGTEDFYVEDAPNGMINRTAYRNGSNYLFADGTVRHIPLTEYRDSQWQLNPDGVSNP